MSSTPALFNALYFSALTFDQASRVNLPTTLPENSVLSFTWHQGSSPSAQPSSVFHTIPHLNDLQPIFHDFDKMQQEGFNNVRLMVHLQGSAAEECFISLDKLCCFAHIHNNIPAINSATTLYCLIQSLSSKSEKFRKMVNVLATTPIQSYTMGFLSTEPLWTLSCLVWDPQEQGIFNTVVDLWLEATTLQLQLLQPQRLVWVLTPTMFIHSLRQLYSKSNPKFNPELQLLQTHVQGLRDAHNFARMVFLDCDRSHWVLYVYDGTHILGYGNSLGQNCACPSPVLLQALNWFLQDAELLLVEDVTALDVSVQSLESQSCALVAFNAAKWVIRIPGIAKWGLKDSNAHWIRCIEDILTMHICAREYSSDCPWYSAIHGDTLSKVPESGDLKIAMCGLAGTAKQCLQSSIMLSILVRLLSYQQVKMRAYHHHHMHQGDEGIEARRSLKFVLQGPIVDGAITLPPLPQISLDTNIPDIPVKETPLGGVISPETKDFQSSLTNITGQSGRSNLLVSSQFAFETHQLSTPEANRVQLGLQQHRKKQIPSNHLMNIVKVADVVVNVAVKLMIIAIVQIR
ncbi:hypothetical protein M407DRAFT_10192 [Tulasnella calospora MUT 4182]|uniref:Uncharacterized protein n=1 Tax=Tulasnella calospora MUT 4182 TaxID=1051891 RepID=A0A0C3Q189_9AGAM|nr:hypothetical protein M407DRAFT_10192 [Tulasnella calospora MUT 4182]